MTSTKKRSIHKPPSILSGNERKRWRELVIRMDRLQRGLEELSEKRIRLHGKTDFDVVAEGQKRLLLDTEVELEGLEAHCI